MRKAIGIAMVATPIMGLAAFAFFTMGPIVFGVSAAATGLILGGCYLIDTSQ